MSKDRILQLSREHGGERYVKRFDCWAHLVVMLYAVIMRFDSLREITASLQGEARKLVHLGISMMPPRCPMPTAVAPNLFLRPYTVTCTPDTATAFRRTAGAARSRPG